MELITVQEVESACDRLIQRLYRSRDKKQNE